MYYDTNILIVLIASMSAVFFSELWVSSYGLGSLYRRYYHAPINMYKGSQHEKLKSFGLLLAIQICVSSALYFLLLVTRAKTLGQIMTIAFMVWVGFYLSRVCLDMLVRKTSVQIMLLEGGKYLFVLATTVLIMSVLM